jgi:hypothetical protein
MVDVGSKIMVTRNPLGDHIAIPLGDVTVDDNVIVTPDTLGNYIIVKGGSTANVILCGTDYHYASPLDVTRPYILRSMDDGLSFTRVLEANVVNMAFRFVTTSGIICIAGTYPYGKIYRSINSGANWTLLAATDIFGVNGGYTDCTWASPLIAYVTSWNTSTLQGKVWKTVDAGATWICVATTAFQPHKIVCGQSGVLLIGTYSSSYSAKIYRSTDGGVNWTLVYTIPVSGTTFSALEYLENGIVLAGGAGGTGSPHYTYPGHVFRSIDNGLTWVDRGIFATYMPDITWYYYCGQGLVYMGTGLNALLESTDYGYSFHYIPGEWHNPGFSCDCVILKDKKTAIDTVNGESYYDGLLRSTDLFATYTLSVPTTTPFTQHKFSCITLGKTGVTAPLLPVTDFSADYTTKPACDGLITFTDLSTNSPISWLWEFGDGGTSTLKNPTHRYTGAGAYNVSLTATNAVGSKKKTKYGYITISPAEVPYFVLSPYNASIGGNIVPALGLQVSVASAGSNGVTITGWQDYDPINQTKLVINSGWTLQPARCARYLDFDFSDNSGSRASGFGSDYIQMHGHPIDGSSHVNATVFSPTNGHHRLDFGAVCSGILFAIWTAYNYDGINAVSTTVTNIEFS